MKLSHLFLILVLCAVVSAAVARSVTPKTADSISATIKETRWEQVKKSGVLRCGYGVWAPFLVKDPNTGKMSGAFYDIVEEIGKKLSLKVEWTAEMNWGEMFSGYNRYDMVCAPFIRTGARARETDFSATLGYIPLNIYVRNDDKRFDNNLAALNHPEIKFATIDGDYSDIMAMARFPEAGKDSLTQAANGSILASEVVMGKADAFITEPFTVDAYLASNPGKVRAVDGGLVGVQNFALPLPPNEYAFKQMIDGALAELFDAGVIDKIFAKYEPGSARVLRVTKAYQ